MFCLNTFFLSLAELSESEDESDPLDEEEEEPELEPELLELLLPLLLALGRGLGGMVGSEPMPQLWIFLISSKRKNVSLRAAVLQGFASFYGKISVRLQSSGGSGGWSHHWQVWLGVFRRELQPTHAHKLSHCRLHFGPSCRPCKIG